MTMIDPTPITLTAPTLTPAEPTREELLEKQVIAANRKEQDLFEAFNTLIEENEADEDTTLTYGEVNEVLESVFGRALRFSKEYEATVRFTVDTVVRFKATSSEEAQEIADSIELNIDEDDISYYGDAEVSELYVNDTRVRSVEEQ